MKTVTLIMIDSLTGKEVIRDIHIINAMRSGSECWELGGVGSQRERLELWIKERGNEQHDTKLKLKEWYIN